VWPRHAEAHRGRHLLPPMPGLARDVGDLVHVREARGDPPGLNEPAVVTVEVLSERKNWSTTKNRRPRSQKDGGGKISKRAPLQQNPGLLSHVVTWAVRLW
jgi:hypothetical protein